MESGDFVGRARELALFREWATAAASDTRWIAFFYDALEAQEKKGGVGKTWLLRECITLTREIYPDAVVVSIDFFNAGMRDGAIVADQVVDALKVAYPNWFPDTFSEVLSEYRNVLQSGKEDILDARNRLADALTVDLHQLEMQLQEDRKYLFLFFDTYEMVEQNPLVSVLRFSQAFPDNYNFEHIGVVIASRNPIDWSQPNWNGRESEVLLVPVSPFTQGETAQYLERFCNKDFSADPAGVLLLHQRTEGRPILVGLAADVINHDILSLENLLSVPSAYFEEGLITQINCLQRPIDLTILFMAHAYHRFSFELLEWILKEPVLAERWEEKSPEKIASELLQLSFVRRANNSSDFVLHDEMRELVIKYCWDLQDPDKRYRQAISQRALEYYEYKLKDTEHQLLRQAYTVEMLYHKFHLDLTEGYQFFHEHFLKAINLLLKAFARSLLQEARRVVDRLTPEQQNNLRFFEAQLLRAERNSIQALELLERLERESDLSWLAEHRVGIPYEKGVCYQQLNHFSEAITQFTLAKEREKELGHLSGYASILDWLGSVYQQQGDLDTALHHFEESIEIHKQQGTVRAYASALNSISNVYRLQGKIEEALRRSKLSWRLRYDLFQQGKMSEIYVGWSLKTVGEIYLYMDDFAQAEQFFQRSFEIFSRTGHEAGIASLYNRFGYISMTKNNLSDAIKWFEKAYYTALGTDRGAQIYSLNKQGWISVLERQYEKAVGLLQQAINLAKEIHDVYQEAESLIDLTSAFEYLGRHEDALIALQQGEEISKRYNYYYLLSLARESDGYIRCQFGEYRRGFQSYAQACHYMAKFNPVKYKKTLRIVLDRLLEIPREEIVPSINILISYWQSQGLVNDYPELTDACEELCLLIDI